MFKVNKIDDRINFTIYISIWLHASNISIIFIIIINNFFEDIRCVCMCAYTYSCSIFPCGIISPITWLWLIITIVFSYVNMCILFYSVLFLLIFTEKNTLLLPTQKKLAYLYPMKIIIMLTIMVIIIINHYFIHTYIW